jgi:hypothetical protein
MAVYDDVLDIAKNYMGMAAEEYIARRCRVSLGVEAKELAREHLSRLAESIEMTAGVYVGEERVKKFKNEIIAIGNK